MHVLLLVLESYLVLLIEYSCDVCKSCQHLPSNIEKLEINASVLVGMKPILGLL